MYLSEEYRDYKLSTVNQGSTNAASNQNFVAYFAQRHSSLNKFKNINKIEKDYDDDLNSILSIEGGFKYHHAFCISYGSL